MLRRLYVHNFRCLGNLDLAPGDEPSILLIGKNASGKSSLRHALQLLQRAARGTNRVAELVRPRDIYRSRHAEPVRIEVEVEIEKRLHQYRLALELPPGFTELRVRSESLIHDGEVVFTRELSQVSLGDEGEGSRGFRIDWHVVALPLIHERSMSDPLALFKRWLARMLIVAPIPSLISGESSGETLTPDPEMRQLGAWFAGLIAQTPSVYGVISRYLGEILTDLQDIQNPIIGEGARSLQVRFRKGEQASLRLPFALLSDGEKCFFICALVLAACEAHGPLLCFWDEPDSHLALDEVSHFIMTLRRDFKKTGGQLLVTSHSEETIRRFSDHNTFVLYRRDHLEPTRLKRLDEIDHGEDLIGALIQGEVASWE